MENKKLYIVDIETKQIRSITLSMLVDSLNMDGIVLSDPEYIYLNYQDAIECLENQSKL